MAALWPRIAVVISSSASPWTALARASVVWICSQTNSPSIIFRNAARRRGSGILTRLPATRCLTLLLPRMVCIAIEPGEAIRASPIHLADIRQEVSRHKSLAQLLQALLAEVTDAQQVLLTHHEHLPDLGDAATLQAVIRADREIQLLDQGIEDLRRNRVVRGAALGIQPRAPPHH